MHARFSYAHFEWSYCKIYHYFHNQNISFVEQGVWKKWHFCSIGLYEALHCVHTAIVPVFQCHALKMHVHVGLLTKSATFFLAPDCINSVISQYSGDYGQ